MIEIVEAKIAAVAAIEISSLVRNLQRARSLDPRDGFTTAIRASIVRSHVGQSLDTLDMLGVGPKGWIEVGGTQVRNFEVIPCALSGEGEVVQEGFRLVRSDQEAGWSLVKYDGKVVEANDADWVRVSENIPGALK